MNSFRELRFSVVFKLKPLKNMKNVTTNMFLVRVLS